ncbi:MAG TPA: type IV pili twitching motility protein PilT, partial [Nitrospirales bacterium]|nr:type IV pili twitching motility protein PilT [Nitrospirales bacterium]
METMDELLLDAVDKKASDIHLKTDNPPIFRLDGTLTRMDGAELTNDDVETLLSE